MKSTRSRGGLTFARPVIDVCKSVFPGTWGCHSLALPVTKLMLIARRLTAVALLLLMQGPAMLVQEVAWVKMLASYTQQRGLVKGVVETFDGDHPCKLCKKAQELRRQQQQENPNEPKPAPEQRRLTWGEMIAATALQLKQPHSFDAVLPMIAWARRGTACWPDGPEPPPPERA